MQGISERNLLDDVADFQGNSLVTAVDIDQITTSNRRTSSGLIASTVGGDDIVLAYGSAVTAVQIGMLRTTVNNLIRAVQEFLYKNG